LFIAALAEIAFLVQGPAAKLFESLRLNAPRCGSESGRSTNRQPRRERRIDSTSTLGLASSNGHDAIGDDQVTRVRRRDAIALRQSHDLLDQLLFLAVGTNLVEQIADLATRPQLLDEVLSIARLLRERHF